MVGCKNSKGEKLTNATACDGGMAGFHRQSEKGCRETGNPHRKLKGSSGDPVEPSLASPSLLLN